MKHWIRINPHYDRGEKENGVAPPHGRHAGNLNREEGLAIARAGAAVNLRRAEEWNRMTTAVVSGQEWHDFRRACDVLRAAGKSWRRLSQDLGRDIGYVQAAYESKHVVEVGDTKRLEKLIDGMNPEERESAQRVVAGVAAAGKLMRREPLKDPATKVVEGLMDKERASSSERARDAAAGRVRRAREIADVVRTHGGDWEEVARVFGFKSGDTARRSVTESRDVDQKRIDRAEGWLVQREQRDRSETARLVELAEGQGLGENARGIVEAVDRLASRYVAEGPLVQREEASTLPPEPVPPRKPEPVKLDPPAEVVRANGRPKAPAVIVDSWDAIRADLLAVADRMRALAAGVPLEGVPAKVRAEIVAAFQSRHDRLLAFVQEELDE